MMGRFFQELRRRKVFRAAIAYIASVWVVLQIADILVSAFDAPDWTMTTLLAALVVGFPFAMAFSWFFEVSSSGIKRTRDFLPNETSVVLFDRRFDFIIIAILVAGLALSLYGNFRSPDEAREPVTILIADFENQSGNALFSGVLEDFLLVGLEVAPFVDAYSRKKAKSIAAGLPGADPDSNSLSLEAAALVALRQSINVVVGGEVSRDDDGLVLSVVGISPGDQRKLFSVREAVESDADILTAITDVSKKLRLELGDTEKPVGAGENESFAVTNLEAAAEYLKAQDLQLDRKLEEAVMHYEKALVLDPDFARAYAGLALTEQYLGNPDAATENWKEALARLNRLTERGRLRTLGNYFMINQGNYEKALETYDTLVEKYPADNVAQNNLAVTAFYAMDFPRALEVGRDVARRFPNHNGYRANLALYAMYASRFDEASDEARTVIDSDPSSAYAFFVRALTAAVAGDFQAAQDAYDQMLQLDQFGRSVAAEGLADISIYRKEFDDATEFLNDAIDEEMGMGSIHTATLKQAMKMEIMLQTGALEEARNIAAEVVPSSGGDPAILVPAAFALIELDEFAQAEAIAALLENNLSKPRKAYAYAIRAQLAAAKGDSQAAIEHANTALETVDLWLIRFTRAKILLDAGLTADAAADLLVCRQRIGEGIAVFLNDRPSFRLVRELEEAELTLGTVQ